MADVRPAVHTKFSHSRFAVFEIMIVIYLDNSCYVFRLYHDKTWALLLLLSLLLLLFCWILMKLINSVINFFCIRYAVCTRKVA